jgi:hypothetical protein
LKREAMLEEARLKREELAIERALEQMKIRNRTPSGDGNVPEVVRT